MKRKRIVLMVGIWLASFAFVIGAATALANSQKGAISPLDRLPGVQAQAVVPNANGGGFVSIAKDGSTALVAGDTLTYSITVDNSSICAGNGNCLVTQTVDTVITDMFPATAGAVSCSASYYDSSAAPVVVGTLTEANLMNCVDGGDLITPRDPFACSGAGNGIDGGALAAGSAQCQVDTTGLADAIISSVDFDVTYQTGISATGTWETEFNVFFDVPPVTDLFGGNFGGYGAASNPGPGVVLTGTTPGSTIFGGSHTNHATGTWDVFIYEGFNDVGDIPDSCLVDFSMDVFGYPYVTTPISGDINISALLAAADLPDASDVTITCTSVPDWNQICGDNVVVNFDNVAMANAAALGEVPTSTHTVSFDPSAMGAGCDALAVTMADSAVETPTSGLTVMVVLGSLLLVGATLSLVCATRRS